MSHNERQQAYKAIAYVSQGGCAQPACRDDQSDTTTIHNFFGRPAAVFDELSLNSQLYHMRKHSAYSLGMKSKNNQHCIVKQMRPAAHVAVTCGTTFTDALSKMAERKQVIALFTMQCFVEWTQKFVACMQLHGFYCVSSTASCRNCLTVGVHCSHVHCVAPYCVVQPTFP